MRYLWRQADSLPISCSARIFDGVPAWQDVCMHRIFGMAVSRVYPLYVAKLERKGRNPAELDAVIKWLTGFQSDELAAQLASNATFAEFFGAATLNPNAALITGLICGVRVEQIEDPLMQKIRYLDKLVDELANGKPLEKVLRGQ